MNAKSNVITLERPKHVTSLATSGILVTVEVSSWTGSKHDRVISDEVAVAKKASTEAGRYVKHLLAGDQTHKRVVNHRQTVYNWLRQVAYPWTKNQYYVPTLNVPRFMQEWAKLAHEYEDVPGTLLRAFLDNYQSIVSNAAFTQGDMFKREDYPSLEQVKSKFKMRLYTAEVPENDFRNLVSKDLAEDLHNTYSRQTEEIIDRILSTQAKQLITVMESLSRCCDSDTVMDKDGHTKVKRRRIYDSTVQRALELCNTFQQFNLTENPHLDKAARALQKTLADVSLDTLRESDSTRERVKQEVDDILSKFRPVAPQFDTDDDEE